ncbi:MAG: hypothetical protein HGB14_10495 [Anaerolineaceae bacterium]|nr:hypothetical protein [Anaerolineaceae bacterium]
MKSLLNMVEDFTGFIGRNELKQMKAINRNACLPFAIDRGLGVTNAV